MYVLFPSFFALGVMIWRSVSKSYFYPRKGEAEIAPS